MMECLEKFEDILEKESSSSQQMLRMLLFASQTKVDWKWLLARTKIVTNKELTCTHHLFVYLLCLQARKRTVTIGRANRGELLQFELIGGHEKSFGVFVDTVSSLSFCSWIWDEK